MPDLMEVRVSQPAMSVIKVKNIRNSALLARLIPAAVMPHPIRRDANEKNIIKIFTFIS